MGREAAVMTYLMAVPRKVPAVTPSPTVVHHSGPAATAVVMNVLVNIVLIAAIIVFVVALLKVVFHTTNPIEKAIRAGALACAALVVLGAQGSGASYADFIVKSLSNTKPLSAGVLGVLLPAASGIGIAWYMVRTIKRSYNLAVRTLAFVGMLMVVQFATTYAIALHIRGFELGIAALPNISFVVGLILYFVFKYEPGSPKESIQPPDDGWVRTDESFRPRRRAG